MALSPSAAWLAAVARADFEPAYLVTITDGTTTWKATNNLGVHLGYDCAVHDVQVLPDEIDPFERTVSIGHVSVTFADAWLRDKWVATRLGGQKLTVQLGAYGLAEGEFIARYVGVIPFEPMVGENTITLECRSLLDVAMRRKVSGFWSIDHPLVIAQDILETKCDYDTAYIDTATFDETDSDYDAFGHFCVSRGAGEGDGSVEAEEPPEAQELLDEIAFMLRGCFRADEAGLVGFKVFDAAGADFAWTKAAGDIIEIEQRGEVEYLYNQVQLRFGPKGKFLWEQDDATSQAAFAFPGSTTRIVTFQRTLNWINAAQTMTLKSDVTDSATSWDCRPGLSVTGHRGADDPGTQPTEAKCTSGRPGWFRIGLEIVKCTGMTFTGDVQTGYIADREIGVQSYAATVREVTCTMARAQLSTTATVHVGWDNYDGANTAYPPLVDCTVPKYIADAVLARFGSGAPVVRVRTPLRHYATQIGDVGTIVHDRYVAYGADGIDATTKWEVVSKDVREAESSIDWILVRASTSSPTTTVKTPRMPASTVAGIMAGNVFRGAVVRGLDVSIDSGLDGIIAAGQAANGLSQFDYPQISKTFTASKDTYVYADTIRNTIVYREVANGAAEPAEEPGTALIAKVVTDGSGITDIDDSGAERTTIDGRHIVVGTVRAAQVEKSFENTGNMLFNGNFSQFSRG